MSALYRLVWFFAMVLVMAPAFIMSSFVDGLSYSEGTVVAFEGMASVMFFPYELASFLAPAVTVVGQLLPASSSFAVTVGEMIWEHIGVIMTFLFFAFVRAPFIDNIDARFNAQGRTKPQ